jgi:hypothetical protein
MRLTYASRRAWPARGGIERYLVLFARYRRANGVHERLDAREDLIHE